MAGSFIDMLPPEAQQLLGGIAVLVMAAGFVVWIAGVKIARFSVAMLMGLGVAALGAWLLPNLLGVEIITGGLVGFAIGALAGALGFRLLQGLVLASCLGIAVGGMYYRWHIGTELRASAVSSAHGKLAAGNKPGEIPMSELLIPTDRLSMGSASKPAKGKTSKMTFASRPGGIIGVLHALADQWNAIPPVHQRRLLIVSIGTAAVALLIAFGFARQTTLVISALLGSLMVLAGVRALVHVYGAGYERYLPGEMRNWFLTLGVMTLIGAGIQYRMFWPKRKRPATGGGTGASQGDSATVAA